jgi:DNA polymerase-3 subunit delta
VTLGSLYYFFTKLLMLHYTKDRSKQNLASVLKVNPFFVQDYQRAAGHYSAAQLVDVLSLLREYDLRSKGWEGNTVGDGELLKELVFKILHR